MDKNFAHISILGIVSVSNKIACKQRSTTHSHVEKNLFQSLFRLLNILDVPANPVNGGCSGCQRIRITAQEIHNKEHAHTRRRNH